MKVHIGLFTLLLGHWISAQQFYVSYSTETHSDPFTGSVILYLSKENPNPKDAFLPIELPPVYRLEVDGLAPGEQVVFDDKSISYPVELSNIERGDYYVQAVFDRNLGGQFIASSEGNLYSNPIKVTFDKDFDKKIEVVCTEVVDAIPFKETDHLKELKLKSSLLSEFHKEEAFIAGAVQLPKDYYDSDRSYPVIFSVFGFGANYKTNAGQGKYYFDQINNEPAIVVYLDGNCKEGHSTYANSDINGPWGDALVKEFIPELAKNYRTNGAQFLFGHSSGGWTVLWLQLNYPETFAGCWSSAPDQVDFRNWQGINIYEDTNKFNDENGAPRHDFFVAGRFPMISAKDLYSIEKVVERGEQSRSFDAVFSSRDENGEIVRLVNPQTGEVNNEAANELFRRYDISYQMRTNWDDYKDITEKIRISVGIYDNFQLHEAVRLLESEMKKLDATMDFEYFPGDHWTIFTEDYINKGRIFLGERYQIWKGNQE